MLSQPFAAAESRRSREGLSEAQPGKLAAMQHSALTLGFVSQPCFSNSSQPALELTQRSGKPGPSRSSRYTHHPTYFRHLYQLIMHRAQVHTVTRAGSVRNATQFVTTSNNNHGQTEVCSLKKPGNTLQIPH